MKNTSEHLNKLPSNIEEWTAMEMTWGHPPGVDFFDIMTASGSWTPFNVNEARRSRTAVVLWFNRNLDWLITHQIARFSSMTAFELRFEVNPKILWGEMFVIPRSELRKLLRDGENLIEQHISENKPFAT